MNKNTCWNCIWYNDCGSVTPCNDIDMIIEDTDRYIEQQRREFQSEWNAYLEDRLFN
jgi:hypothetical protein